MYVLCVGLSLSHTHIRVYWAKHVFLYKKLISHQIYIKCPSIFAYTFVLYTTMHAHVYVRACTHTHKDIWKELTPVFSCVWIPHGHACKYTCETNVSFTCVKIMHFANINARQMQIYMRDMFVNIHAGHVGKETFKTYACKTYAFCKYTCETKAKSVIFTHPSFLSRMY